ncbi:MAG: hypothetical protein ABIJ00_04440 [Candidatus Eisenbacteria bacterium]
MGKANSTGVPWTAKTCLTAALAGGSMAEALVASGLHVFDVFCPDVIG